MKASEAYQEYCAIKAHFERPAYDYNKYCGKVRSSNYETRKDKNWFFRLSRAYNREQLHEYYIANFLAGNSWVGNMTKDAWIEWKHKIVRLQDVVADDLRAIVQLANERNLQIKEVFVASPGEHPILFKLLLGGYIQMETFAILDILTGFSSKWDVKLEGDVIWDEWSQKVKKYSSLLRSFVKDKGAMSFIVKEILLNNLDS